MKWPNRLMLGKLVGKDGFHSSMFIKQTLPVFTFLTPLFLNITNRWGSGSGGWVRGKQWDEQREGEGAGDESTQGKIPSKREISWLNNA